MVKYGEFTIILDNTNYSMFNKLYNEWFPNDLRDIHYKCNNDIIYTFHDNPEQNYSDREIYTSSNDYENMNMGFSSKSPYVLHPSTIHASTFSMYLKVPSYNPKTATATYDINIKSLYAGMSSNPYKLLISQFNCIYMNAQMNKELFSIAKCKTSNTFPSFIFYYDDEILSKKDVLYLIKRIICMDF